MKEFFVDQFSEDIWRTKYAGEFTDVKEYFKSLAQIVSMGDAKLASGFFRLMWERRFTPGGRILAFAGRPTAQISLMNCTTHEVAGDSLEDINQAAYSIMRASSRGQGIGLDLSKLRPKGAPVNNAAKTSTGAISFMEMLNFVGGTIGQEGRRAALLFSMDVSHPDLYRPEDKYDFIHVKRIPGKVENANISVRISDEFMRAVESNSYFSQYFKGTTSGKEFEYMRRLPARDIFNTLAQSAHASAEPGVLFWDNSRRMSNSDLFGEKWEIKGVNACSEEILDQDGVCNLGSMNLAAYVHNAFLPDAWFDYVTFEKDVKLAVEFLDNVISVEIENGNYISQRQFESLVNLRRTGLGVMGLADALAMLGEPYSSTSKSLPRMFESLRNAAYAATIDLARRKGPAKVWEDAEHEVGFYVERAFFATLPEYLKDLLRRYGSRNITVLSLAPTGSISNLIGVSSGIEPVFAHEYIRRVRMNGQDEFITYVHPGVQAARKYGLADKVYPTAYEVTPQEHVRVQAIVQQYTDASIAKTLNFPAMATAEDVGQAYMEGWRLGLKGMAVYVDGSREMQVLHVVERKKDEFCPVCGSSVIHEEGCTSCSTCDWAKCSI
jgi:ribonucleoside-diphosphate reductase alpha chain